MEVNVFIHNYREAFGEAAELPVAFWYSGAPFADTESINGCIFKGMDAVRAGGAISLSEENTTCGGGKFYMGFTEMPERVPNFVSLKEKYKKTPEMVTDAVERLGVRRASGRYLNFARIDKIDGFDNVEGILFLATPDILSGLATWAYFDNNAEDAVTAPFGSGCSSIITQAVNENKRGGRRTFIGLFDPSARLCVEADRLSYVIPMSRFREMYCTMRESCLFGTHAWGRVRERVSGGCKAFRGDK